MTSNADAKCQGPSAPPRPNIAIYSGGKPTMEDIKEFFTAIGSAGYTTVILWAAHVDSAGNIKMNGDPIAVDGNFPSSAQLWADLVNALRPPCGQATRIELSIGGDSTSFLHIKALMSKYGEGPDNPLYGNLQILQKVLQLGLMCAGLGMRVSMCPYDWPPYWIDLVTAINTKVPGTADAIYLQCYDGGGAIRRSIGAKCSFLRLAWG